MYYKLYRQFCVYIFMYVYIANYIIVVILLYIPVRAQIIITHRWGKEVRTLKDNLPRVVGIKRNFVNSATSLPLTGGGPEAATLTTPTSNHPLAAN